MDKTANSDNRNNLDEDFCSSCQIVDCSDHGNSGRDSDKLFDSSVYFYNLFDNNVLDNIFPDTVGRDNSDYPR